MFELLLEETGGVPIEPCEAGEASLLCRDGGKIYCTTSCKIRNWHVRSIRMPGESCEADNSVCEPREPCDNLDVSNHICEMSPRDVIISKSDDTRTSTSKPNTKHKLRVLFDMWK